MQTVDQLNRELISYIDSVVKVLPNLHRDFPTHAQLKENHESVQVYLSLFLQDFNKLAKLHTSLAVKRVSLQLLQKTSGSFSYTQGPRSPLSATISRLYDLQQAVSEAKKSCELTIEAIRSIQTARVTYDRLTAQTGGGQFRV